MESLDVRLLAGDVNVQVSLVGRFTVPYFHVFRSIRQAGQQQLHGIAL